MFFSASFTFIVVDCKVAYLVLGVWICPFPLFLPGEMYNRDALIEEGRFIAEIDKFVCLRGPDIVTIDVLESGKRVIEDALRENGHDFIVLSCGLKKVKRIEIEVRLVSDVNQVACSKVWVFILIQVD